jgi:Uma2 family endonuclease
VTVQEFLALPEIEGERIELIGGEVVSMGRGGSPHEVVKKNLIKILVTWLAQNPIAELFAETTFEIDEHNSPIPDLSLIVPGHILPGSTGLVQGSPYLAIEVVSSEKAAVLERKIAVYLAHGGKSVWVVFPEQRTVGTFDGAGRSKKFEQNQTLEDQAALPGFQVAVAAIFDGV